MIGVRVEKKLGNIKSSPYNVEKYLFNKSGLPSYYGCLQNF